MTGIDGLWTSPDQRTHLERSPTRSASGVEESVGSERPPES